jgi:hypothetical protein
MTQCLSVTANGNNLFPTKPGTFQNAIRCSSKTLANSAIQLAKMVD